MYTISYIRQRSQDPVVAILIFLKKRKLQTSNKMDIEEPNHLKLEAHIQALMDYGVNKPLTIFNNVKKFHKVSERTVYNKINLIQSGQSLQRKQYFRKNTKIDDDMVDEIIEYFEENGHAGSVRQLKIDHELDISETRIIEILQEQGIQYQKVNILPMLTNQQEQNRVEFSKKYLNFNWNNTVFVDEVSFWTHQIQTHVWCLNQENLSLKVQKYPHKVHAFAGISK
ncbi:Tc1-like transposase [Tetrahymena thermophila SB210]|uniref:Tc1-like transposase n=1 Tax=Tetrahymena thermophila (strain SB210) TaxID=312017 RepID=A0A1B9C2E4_TETTS|nr:Tc1-like transposase [Tetrahymena thermophila SB210]